MIGQGRGVKVDELKKIMQGLSLPTGGRALFTDSIDELHGAFNELLDELSNQYLLGYAPANAPARQRVAQDQGQRGRLSRGARAAGLPRVAGKMTQTYAALIAAAGLLLLIGQQPSFQTAIDLTPIDVAVVDDHGKPISNLTAADFQVRIERQRAPGRQRGMDSDDRAGEGAGRPSGRLHLE